MKGAITGSSALDERKPTSEGTIVSGDSIPKGTITVSFSQDNVGKVVHTPESEIPMMGDVKGIAHSARRACQLKSTFYLFIVVALIF